MKALESYTIKNMVLNNRIVMPPMCTFAGEDDGLVSPFHMAHYIVRAYGGVGLIILEATGVVPDGRVSNNDIGLWNDQQRDSLKPLVEECQKYGAKMCVQLNHSGRKWSGAEVLVGPSPIPFDERSETPKELSVEDIKLIVKAFGDAARRADEAGFDSIELHGAHGYLIHQFLSPISNQRTDEYGGDRVKRSRFLREVLEEVQSKFSKEKPIILRLSASEHRDDGYSEAELIETINDVKELVDMIHVTTGGNGAATIDVFPGYQVGQCERIKQQCEMPTIAVGRITKLEMIEEILGNNRADLVALGKELLRQPNFIYNSAFEKGYKIDFPDKFSRAYRSTRLDD